MTHLLALALLIAGTPSRALPTPIVSAVAWDCDGPADAEVVARLMEVMRGEPLDGDAVRRTIQNLTETGLYSRVWVEDQPAEGGRVSLTFHLYRAFIVTAIGFKGAPISSEDLRRSLGFHVGDALDAVAVDEGRTRVERQLATVGFFEALVVPSVEKDAATFRARVTYRVTAGAASVLVAPAFDGGLGPFTSAALAHELKLSTGSRYREERVQRAAARLKGWLTGRDHLKADVSLIGVDREGLRATPVIRIEVGPKIVFHVRGFSEKKVRKDFAVLVRDQLFQEDLLAAYVVSLRRRLQAKGYHEVKISSRLEGDETTQIVSLDVDQGSRSWISELRLDGVSPALKTEVRAHFLTVPRSLIHRGYLIDEVLEEDRRAVEAFYRSRGYTLATAGAPITSAGRRDGARILTVPVSEGPQTIVESRELAGCDHLDRSKLEAKFRTLAGAPLDPQKVEDDRATIVNAYRDDGWSQVTARTDVRFSDDRRTARVSFTIAEGDRYFFGKTIFRGNSRTDSGRLRVPIRWHEGEPFSESRVLDAQRELSRTGVFQKVEAKPDAADPATGERNVLVDVVEGRPLSLLYGVGYEYDDTTGGDQGPFGILGISYNNLFGNLQSISLETRFSPTTKQNRVFLNFHEPYFLDLDLPLTASAFYAREPIQNIDVQRRGTFVEVSRPIGGRSRVGLRWEFQRIDVGSSNPLDLAQLQTFDRNISEMTVGLTALYDRRDDPIEPHRGLFLNGVIKGAAPVKFLSADAHYLKGYGQASEYVPLFGGVLAGSVRLGLIGVPGECRNDGTTPSACIPIAARFFSGGRTSNRGFDTNVQGISGSTVDYSVIQVPVAPGTGTGCGNVDPTKGYSCNFGPRLVGGAATGGLNAEWRFPIAGDLGGTLFYDATQIWPDAHVSFRIEGADGLRQSVGVGLRYSTPVGPLRFEYGRVLRPQTLTVPVLRENPANGQILDTGNKTTVRESADQLFLSIGYPF